MEKKLYRPFQISCGLREGYDLSAPEHTITDARNIIQYWMEDRMKQEKKIVVGALVEGQFIYPLVEGSAISSSYEPSFYFKGIVREDASNKEAQEILFDLAKELALKLKQKRVHIELESDYFLYETE